MRDQVFLATVEGTERRSASSTGGAGAGFAGSRRAVATGVLHGTGAATESGITFVGVAGASCRHRLGGGRGLSHRHRLGRSGRGLSRRHRLGRSRA